MLGENESNIFSKRIKGWYSIMGAGSDVSEDGGDWLAAELRD